MNRASLTRSATSVVERAGALWRFDRGVVAQPAQRSKRRHLLALFEERGHETLIDTGTYLGDTVRFAPLQRVTNMTEQSDTVNVINAQLITKGKCLAASVSAFARPAAVSDAAPQERRKAN